MRIGGSHLGRIPNCSEVPDTIFFIGGGFGGPGGRFRGQYPRAAKNPLKPPPPKTPPFFKFGSGGGFKHDIRFLRIPPPPACARPPGGRPEVPALPPPFPLTSGANNNEHITRPSRPSHYPVALGPSVVSAYYLGISTCHFQIWMQKLNDRGLSRWRQVGGCPNKSARFCDARRPACEFQTRKEVIEQTPKCWKEISVDCGSDTHLQSCRFAVGSILSKFDGTMLTKKSFSMATDHYSWCPNWPISNGAPTSRDNISELFPLWTHLTHITHVTHVTHTTHVTYVTHRYI